MTSILIVDDNAKNLYLLESLLKAYGYDVITARNGSEALDMAMNRQPDLIIADILMPVMDGFELCRRCKADEELKKIPLMFYTATYTDLRDEQFALRLGADRFVVKPQNPDVLRRIVEELLKNSQGKGTALPGKPPDDEMEILRQYNDTLFRKLEKKMNDLEKEIAERRQIEADLRASEAKFRMVVENVPDFILVHRGGTILYINTTLLNTTGYEPDEILNHPFTTFIAPEYRNTVESVIARRMRGEPVEPYEVDILTKSGSRMTVMIRGSRVQFNGIPASLNVLTDITERKRAEERINLANRKLALMTEVTYQDIQNKVTGIRGYVELLINSRSEEDRKSYIQKEIEILESIHNLITKTKDFQQMGVDQSQWIPLEKSIRLQFSLLSLKHNVALDCSLHGLEVYCDPLIDRVLYSLMHNAIKHGKKTTRVSFSCRKIPSGILLVCEDDGVGIPPEQKSLIFERVAGGGGKFGLFFVREFLLLFGMTITETGTPGKGARFEISMPESMCRYSTG